MGEKRTAYSILVGKPEGERPRARKILDGRITRKWVLERSDEVVWTGLTWLRIGTSRVLL
jgi:hypothetical protein